MTVPNLAHAIAPYLDHEGASAGTTGGIAGGIAANIVGDIFRGQ